MTASTLTDADAWLYATLDADATLAGLLPGGIHAWPFPGGTVLPAAAFQLVDGIDREVVGNGGVRTVTELEYLVRAVAEGHSYPASAADRIDLLIHGQASGDLLACQRLRPFSMSEPGEGGTEYRHRGGYYRLIIQTGA